MSKALSQISRFTALVSHHWMPAVGCGLRSAARTRKEALLCTRHTNAPSGRMIRVSWSCKDRRAPSIARLIRRLSRRLTPRMRRQHGQNGTETSVPTCPTTSSAKFLSAVSTLGCASGQRRSGSVIRLSVTPQVVLMTSFTLAIAHREGDRAILDAIREVRAPFDPPSVVADFARLLKTYRVYSTRGDNYSSEWVRSEFRSHGIGYIPSERTKSENLYRRIAIIQLRDGQPLR